jgi:hypothetical protein
MASEASTKSTQASREELDTISNRVAIALAKREKLIKSWTASSTREKEPEKTPEELDAEDAAIFKNEPPYLGVGAPIPSHFLISDAERNNKTLRAKFFPAKGLKASKQRDAEEKAASAKRGLNVDSSDDEGGRSSLGTAKKQKVAAPSKPVKELEKKVKIDFEDKDVTDNVGKVGVFYKSTNIVLRFALEPHNSSNYPPKAHSGRNSQRNQRSWRYGKL